MNIRACISLLMGRFTMFQTVAAGVYSQAVVHTDYRRVRLYRRSECSIMGSQRGGGTRALTGAVGLYAALGQAGIGDEPSDVSRRDLGWSV